MGRFSSLLSIDYSAASQPTRGADSIWVGGNLLGEPYLENFSTRAALHDWLDGQLGRHLTLGARLLAGFDFAFGYPRGFARALGLEGVPWSATWQRLSVQIEDAPNNHNNRFQVADGLNRQLGPMAPFWGRPAHLDLPNLPAKKTVRYDQGLAEWRAFEAKGRTKVSGKRRISGMQPGWKLAYAGSVGSQSLMGIARLQKHRERLGGQLAIWPFEPAESPLVFAEIYPSMFAFGHIDHPIKDARQVLAVAEAMAEADLRQWLNRDQFASDPGVISEEGWLLGWESS